MSRDDLEEHCEGVDVLGLLAEAGVASASSVVTSSLESGRTISRLQLRALPSPAVVSMFSSDSDAPHPECTMPTSDNDEHETRV